MAKVNSAIGIEYNSHEIKAVELYKHSDGRLEIIASGRQLLDNNIMGNGMIMDSALFGVSLNELFTNGKFNKNAPIIIGVNNENVIMRYATFPKVPDDKLRSVVTMQAQDFIPVPIS